MQIRTRDLDIKGYLREPRFDEFISGWEVDSCGLEMKRPGIHPQIAENVSAEVLSVWVGRYTLAR
jgi:hypothetical protein